MVNLRPLSRSVSFALSTSLLLAATLLLPGVAQPECDPAVDHMLVGADAFVLGNYNGAIIAYQCAVDANPLDPQANFALADAALLDGQLLVATSHYNQAIEQTPAHPDTNATVEAELERRMQAVESNPNDPAAHFLRAALLYIVARDDEAMSDYEAALAADPDNAAVLAWQGASLTYLGETESGADAFARARERDGDNPHLLGFIGAVLVETGNLEAAEDDITAALELAPDDFYLLSQQARYYLAAEDTERAITVLERIVQPDSIFYSYQLVRLGAAYLEIGNADAAERWFEAAVRFGNQLPIIYARIGQAYQGVDAAAELDYFYRFAQARETDVGAQDAITVDETLRLHVEQGRVFRLQFDATEEQMLTISVSASETLDPMLFVLNGDSTPLVYNDDADAANGDYAARVENWLVPADGTYTLLVTHAGGYNDGLTNVLISAEPTHLR